jgi:hypothetical protein
LAARLEKGSTLFGGKSRSLKHVDVLSRLHSPVAWLGLAGGMLSTSLTELAMEVHGLLNGSASVFEGRTLGLEDVDPKGVLEMPPRVLIWRLVLLIVVEPDNEVGNTASVVRMYLV